MDDDSPKRYFNDLCTQSHHSIYSIYNDTCVPAPEDNYSTDSEYYRRDSVKSNCKYFISYNNEAFISTH